MYFNKDNNFVMKSINKNFSSELLDITIFKYLSDRFRQKKKLFFNENFILI